MPIDKFGRYVTRSGSGGNNNFTRQSKYFVFPLTSTGAFDLEGRRLSNADAPKYQQDVVTLKYMKDALLKPMQDTEKFYRDNINPLLVKINKDLEDLVQKYKEGIQKLNDFDRKLTNERKEYSNLQKRIVNDALGPINTKLKNLDRLSARVQNLEASNRRVE